MRAEDLRPLTGRYPLRPPLLLVWLVAAVLHIAMGSLGVPVVLIALAACSGALFLPHVSSNFFWMFQSLHTVAMTLASVISRPIVLLLDVVR
ncbi:GntP family permease [Amycolatopsis albispora]|uniref:GntP family permease n=1 Tax=Amycolatopsis albispora TaxID=1804986 RepID=UPI001F45219F|nr:GntP family permease [Amycolatopsis albispora]